MASSQKSSLKASKPSGNRAKTSSLPVNGSLNNPRATSNSAGANGGPPAQPAGTSVLAIYIFEHADSNAKYRVFADAKQVYVIPTPAVFNLTSTMTKGLTYKVFPDIMDCPTKIPGFARLDQILLSKVEIPSADDYKSAPHFRCRVTVAKSTALHANFQILSLGVNLQIPFQVIPGALLFFFFFHELF